jgi:hypothetical protein
MDFFQKKSRAGWGAGKKRSFLSIDGVDDSAPCFIYEVREFNIERTGKFYMPVHRRKASAIFYPCKIGTF